MYSQALLSDLHKTVNELVAVNRLKTEQVAATFDTICQPWQDQEYRNVIQGKFPLLNVKDLDSQIQDALDQFQPEPLKKAA